MSSKVFENVFSRLEQAKERFKEMMCLQVDEMFAGFVKELQSSLKEENVADHKKMTENEDLVKSFGRPPKEWLQEATAVLAQKSQNEPIHNIDAKSTLLMPSTDDSSDDSDNETNFPTSTNLLYVLSSDDESNTDYLEENQAKHNRSKLSAVFWVILCCQVVF